MTSANTPKPAVDALGQPIHIGHLYGYSTSSSGWSRTVVGRALRITKSGQVTLEVVERTRFLYGEVTENDPSSANQVSVRPYMIFPVQS